MKGQNFGLRQRCVFSLVLATSVLLGTGCSEDPEQESCEDGATREFVCGSDKQGRQPQQCVEGTWFSTSFCALPDGTRHPDDPGYVPGPGGGDDGKDRPTDPSTCTTLTNPDVNGGKTLTADSCYVAESTLTVSDGTLVINPGVTLFFGQNAGLVVRDAGRLKAIGAVGKSIWFQGKQDEKGFWEGIVFVGTGSGENVLDHVLVRHAGGKAFHGGSYSRGGVYVDNNDVDVTIANSLFEKNSYAGISTRANGAMVKVSSTTFRNNDAPLALAVEHLGMLSNDLVFEGNKDADNNDRNVVQVLGGTAVITRTATWHPYTYEITPSVKLSNTLTVLPGAVVRFGSRAALEVSGDNATLKAEGTADKPVVFSSIQGRRGTWRGLYFNDSNAPENSLIHAVIEYGGDSSHSGNGDHRGGVYISGSAASVMIRNTTFSENEHAGLSIWGREGSVAVQHSTFSKNAVPLRIGPGALGGLGDDLRFESNDDQTVLVGNRGGLKVNAAATWPALDVPYTVETRIDVANSVTVTPGAHFKFKASTGIHVLSPDGSLMADAAGSDRIVFEGVEALRGSWRGLQFESRKAANMLKNVIIRHAGDSGWHGGASSKAGLFLRGNALVAVDDLAVSMSGGFGISTDNTSVLSGCQNITFSDNAGANWHGNMSGPSDCE